MDYSSWEKAVLEVVSRFADKAYQKTAWFGVGEKISSPEEMYCELFDDLIYEEFLSERNTVIMDHQRSMGLKLKNSLNNYAESVDYLADHEKVYNDCRWDEVRYAAKEFLDAF